MIVLDIWRSKWLFSRQARPESQMSAMHLDSLAMTGPRSPDLARSESGWTRGLSPGAGLALSDLEKTLGITIDPSRLQIFQAFHCDHNTLCLLLDQFLKPSDFLMSFLYDQNSSLRYYPLTCHSSSRQRPR